MLFLPVVYLCNIVLFLAVLNGRFRMLTGLITGGAVFVLSLILGATVAPALNDTAGEIANGINVFLMLAASVFLATNGIAQKLFVGILAVCNYTFLWGVVEHLLGALPFGTSGFMAYVVGSAVYILFTFLSMITFLRPLHLFAARMVSVLSVGLCVGQAACLFAANGTFTGALGITTYPPRFFLTVLIYLFLAFVVRCAYSAARFRERECTVEHRDELLAAEADYFTAMVGNVTNAKTVRDHHNFVLSEISEYAKGGNCEGVLKVISEEGSLHDPLLETYSENPYINAVLAAKAAYARHCGIEMESNVEIGETRLKTVELCVILNDVLAHAIDCAERSGAEERLVRLTVLPVERRITFEAVYPAAHPERKKSVRSMSVNDFVKTLITPKPKDGLELPSVRAILERTSGTMNLTAAGRSEILRIILNV